MNTIEQASSPDLSLEIVPIGTTIAKVDGEAGVLRRSMEIIFDHFPDSDEEWHAHVGLEEPVLSVVEGTSDEARENMQDDLSFSVLSAVGRTREEAIENMKLVLVNMVLGFRTLSSVGLPVDPNNNKLEQLQELLTVEGVAGDESFAANHIFAYEKPARTEKSEVIFDVDVPMRISYRFDGKNWEAFTSAEGLTALDSTSSGNKKVVESCTGSTKKEAHNALMINLVDRFQSFELDTASELIEALSFIPSRTLPAGYTFRSKNVTGFVLRKQLIVHFFRDEDGLYASPQADFCLHADGSGSTEDEAVQSLLEIISCQYQSIRANLEAAGHVATSQDLDWLSLQDFIEMDR